MGHTPGPWFVNEDCVEGPGPEGARDVTVAVVYGDNADRAANARLIAAAPELLAALKMAKDELVDVYEEAYPNDESDNDVTEAIDKAIAAIAKAEGSDE